MCSPFEEVIKQAESLSELILLPYMLQLKYHCKKLSANNIKIAKVIYKKFERNDDYVSKCHDWTIVQTWIYPTAMVDRRQLNAGKTLVQQVKQVCELL